jgi:diketogulonate reductase-like aldo/keto reductase
MNLAIDTKITLNDGYAVPQLGFGVWQIRAGKSCEAATAISTLPSMYGNEESVGAAIRTKRSETRRGCPEIFSRAAAGLRPVASAAPVEVFLA